MKYAVFIQGGMSDRPIPDYNGITPLSSADKAYTDKLAQYSETGLVKTAELMEEPCIEKAVFSLFSYDAKKCFKGSVFFSLCDIGIMPEKEDIAFQCSLVRLSDEEIYEEKTMISCSAENMLEYEFECIFDEISEKLSNHTFQFVKGRNKEIFLIWKKGEYYSGEFSPPEKSVSKCIKDYLPSGDFTGPIYEIMKKSSKVLEDYSLNALWIWDNSAMPKAESFESKFGLKGAVVSDTDFVRGIGRLSGMKVISSGGDVSEKIVSEFKSGKDIVFFYSGEMHKLGLQGDFDGKEEKITEFDSGILKPVGEWLEESGEDFGIMIVSDICVPAYLERRVSDPVPYLIYKSNAKKNSGISSFDENTSADTDNYIEKPHELIERLILTSCDSTLKNFNLVLRPLTPPSFHH